MCWEKLVRDSVTEGDPQERTIIWRKKLKIQQTKLPYRNLFFLRNKVCRHTVVAYCS